MEIVSIMKKPMTNFVLLSNIIFWIFLAVIGIGMALGVPEMVTNTLIVISAWSSTFSLMILFKRIYPGSSFREFVKKQFESKPRFSVLGIVIILQVLICLVTMFLLPRSNNIQNFTLSFSGAGMFLLNFVNHLVRGPLGEELGWRGYVLNELQKKHSPLISSLVIGVLWGFWHTPLWFLTGYTGVNLIKYSVLFMIGVVSVSILMTFFYNLNKNLLVPILIHQLFNFLLSITKGESFDVLQYTMSFYLIVAIVLVVVNPKNILYKSKRYSSYELLKS